MRTEPTWRIPIGLIGLLSVLTVYCLLIALGPRLLADPDTYSHIALGRWILEHHGVPSVDPFSQHRKTKPRISRMTRIPAPSEQPSPLPRLIRAICAIRGQSIFAPSVPSPIPHSISTSANESPNAYETANAKPPPSPETIMTIGKPSFLHSIVHFALIYFPAFQNNYHLSFAVALAQISVRNMEKPELPSTAGRPRFLGLRRCFAQAFSDVRESPELPPTDAAGPPKNSPPDSSKDS